MTDRRDILYYILALAISVVLCAFTYLFQPYQLTALEEVHIMVYDRDYIGTVLCTPGGFSQILASLCTQFFMSVWLGPLIVGVVYAIIVFSLVSIAARLRSRLFVASLSVLPCLCLMLCLENSMFEFQGVTSLMLCALALAGYCRTGRWRLFDGCMMSVILYYLAGSAALSFCVAAMLYDVLTRKPRAWLSCLYPLLALVIGYAFYFSGFLHTSREIYTPSMYYDMGSTYFMMLYAMCSLPAVTIAFVLVRVGTIAVAPVFQCVAAAAVFAVCLGLGCYFFSQVHSPSNYQNNRERYLARQGLWQQIADSKYDGSKTPYTSYRFLALAQQGRLAENIGKYRPFISYIFENKPKVKKRDQQVYSDIYFACDYMAAARHSAFDTDIVTPGAFNPYETQKLVDINIAFGDYAVAEKLIAKLEKTLFYRDWAHGRRRFLYDDAAVEADTVLGPKRRAIPAVNDYMSPKGIGRDLGYIVGCNPEQTVASEFYKAFLILTNQI